jgi:hypothetical protein
LVAKLPSYGLAEAPMGELGSDVLSRFGIVSVDYKAKKLVLGRSEAAAPRGNVYLSGHPTLAPPSGLIKGAPQVSSLLRVLEGPTSTLLAMPVTIDKHAEQFALDTGSASSTLDPSIASVLHLAAGGGTASLSGVGCGSTANLLPVEHWKVAGSSLGAVSPLSYRVAGIANTNIGGAVGSDILSTYGAVVIDYPAAHVWLGAG